MRSDVNPGASPFRFEQLRFFWMKGQHVPHEGMLRFAWALANIADKFVAQFKAEHNRQPSNGIDYYEHCREWLQRIWASVSPVGLFCVLLSSVVALAWPMHRLSSPNVRYTNPSSAHISEGVAAGKWKIFMLDIINRKISNLADGSFPIPVLEVSHGWL
jgi:hypothetical protein